MNNTQTISTSETQAAVLAATDRLIAEAAAKAGLTLEQIPAAAREDARRTAIELVARDEDPHYKMYLEQKRQNEALQAQLAAMSSNTRAVPVSARAPMTVEQLRGQVGPQQYYLLTESQKVAALGVDPATINRVQLKELFGRGSNDRAKQDFSVSNPLQYAKLREVAKALGIYGG